MHTHLYQRLAATVARQPEKTALIFDQQATSYAELEHAINEVRQQMAGAGIEKNDRIVVCCGNRPEAITGFWAALSQGACVSLISDEQPSQTMKYILQDCQAKVLLIRKDLLQPLLEQGLEDTALQRIIVTEADTLEDLSCPVPCVGYRDQVTGRTAVNEAVISEDLAALIYTSGSTGQPKGVTLTQHNMLTALDSLNQYLGNREDDVFLNVLPLSFDYGLYQMIMSFSMGATLVLQKNLVWPLQLFKDIEQYRVTVLPGVPAVFDLLEKFARLSKSDISSVRYVTNTGAALMERHISTVQALFPQARVFSMYGLTECKRCTYLPPEMINDKPKSVGKAIPNTEISVINEAGQVCGPGEIGQLVVRGGTVMRGYWNKPEETAKKIRQHPLFGGRCLFTGDYGYLDEDGFFYFTGRIDEVVKIRGHKVMPLDIERLLMTHDQVTEVAVIALEHAHREPELIAFIEASGGASEAELSRFAQQQLQAHQLPELWVMIDKMPRNTNGKIDKPTLRRGFLANREQAARQGGTQ